MKLMHNFKQFFWSNRQKFIFNSKKIQLKSTLSLINIREKIFKINIKVAPNRRYFYFTGRFSQMRLLTNISVTVPRQTYLLGFGQCKNLLWNNSGSRELELFQGICVYKFCVRTVKIYSKGYHPKVEYALLVDFFNFSHYM